MSSGDQDAVPATLRQRAEDLNERALLGGVFYLLSWLIVAWIGDVWQRSPRLVVLVALAFVLLWMLRLLIRAGLRRDPSRAAASMRRQWTVLLTTAGLWGWIAAWSLLEPSLTRANAVTLLSTISLAMAFAQIFCVNPRLALLGTGLVFVPMIAVVLVQNRAPGVALVLTLNLLYLVAVIGRSHREYESKLALDQQLREQRDRFAELSRTDALTGVANRGHFQQGLAACIETTVPLALLIADLDHFKAINDRYGHTAGDQCLRQVAAMMRQCFPGDALVARLGGEEFGVLLRGEAAFEKMAETFREQVSRLRIGTSDGEHVALTVSLGLARFQPERHGDGDALYAAADAALYRAKQAGRNRLELA